MVDDECKLIYPLRKSLSLQYFLGVLIYSFLNACILFFHPFHLLLEVTFFLSDTLTFLS